MTTTIALLIAVALGGGATFAAQTAEPGDLLYPVKTEVNESVKGAFAIGSEADARLQAQLAAERLEEAAGLAAEGELTTEAKAELRERIVAHLEAAAENAEEAQVNGGSAIATEVRTSLEATARAHADALARLNINLFGTAAAAVDANGGTLTATAQANDTAAEVTTGSDTDGRITVTAGSGNELLTVSLGGNTSTRAEAEQTAGTDTGETTTTDAEIGVTTSGETNTSTGISSPESKVHAGGDADIEIEASNSIETLPGGATVESTTSVEGRAGLSL